MDCYRHPGAAAADTCVGCRQPICPDCREEIAGHPMCRACVAAAESRLSQEGELAGSSAAAGTAAAEQAAAPAPQPLVPPAPAVAAAGAPLVAAIPMPAPLIDGVPPGLVRRLLRGMGWGVLYGQWWTLWTILSMFLWGRGSFSGQVVLDVIVMVILFGFFGSVTGLIIGAANASETTGTAIGVGIGILLCVAEVLLSRSPTMLVNLFFYYFTGRYVGAGITGRVQQLLPSKGRVSDVAAI